jgi:hypothetical protein
MGDPGGLLSILMAMGDEVDIPAAERVAWCAMRVIDGAAQWWDGTEVAKRVTAART